MVVSEPLDLTNILEEWGAIEVAEKNLAKEKAALKDRLAGIVDKMPEDMVEEVVATIIEDGGGPGSLAFFFWEFCALCAHALVRPMPPPKVPGDLRDVVAWGHTRMSYTKESYLSPTFGVTIIARARIFVSYGRRHRFQTHSRHVVVQCRMFVTKENPSSNDTGPERNVFKAL